MRDGVIFDLDGVLIDSEELHFEAYSKVLAPLGVSVTREEYAREWIAGGRGPEYAVRTYGLAMTPQELRVAKNPVYHEILRAHVRLMPGAVMALGRLAAAFPLALATNSNATDVDFVLARFDLRKFFTAVVTRECYTGAKPEPDAFLAAARALEVIPSRCVVIEDAYKGILAAHRAGARVVAIPHDFTKDNDFSLADRLVAGLDEVTVELVSEVLDTPPGGTPGPDAVGM